MLLKFAVISLLLIGCTTPVSEYERNLSELLPAYWRTGRIVRFDIVDLRGRALGQITLKLTQEHPNGDCVPSNWYKADVVSTTITKLPLALWFKDGGNQRPAYEFAGRTIQVVLNPWICDNDVVLRGVINEDSAKGQFASEAMLGGEVYGRFVATFVD